MQTDRWPLAVVRDAAWLVPPAPGIYSAFPRGVYADGRWWVKYLVKSGRGAAAHAAPGATRVVVFDSCADPGISATVMEWDAWRGQGGRDDAVLMPLLGDGAAVRWLSELGWGGATLGGSAFRDPVNDGWYWPVYGRPPDGRQVAGALVWSRGDASGHEVAMVFRDPSADVSELGGTVTADGSLLVVGRTGSVFERPGRWWHVGADRNVIRAGTTPLPLHWPQVCDAGALGIVTIGRSPRGLALMVWDGSDWDTRIAILARAPAWFGDYGYAVAGLEDSAMLRVITYAPDLPTGRGTVPGAEGYPGILQLEVLLGWVEERRGAMRPFRPGEVSVVAQRLLVAADVAGFRRLPLGWLGDEPAVRALLFDGAPPRLLDYRAVVH